MNNLSDTKHDLQGHLRHIRRLRWDVFSVLAGLAYINHNANEKKNNNSLKLHIGKVGIQ